MRQAGRRSVVLDGIEQRLGAGAVDLGGEQVAVQALDIGVGHAGVQFDQQVAGLHVLAIADMDRCDDRRLQRLDQLGAAAGDDLALRDGDDIIHLLPISFSQAALGSEVEVPTVLGSEMLDIPAGVQSGEVLVLRGKGLPHLGGGGRGDQQVRIQVWTPQDLTEEHEELFRRLAEIEGAPPIEGDRSRPGFWSRVKEAFSA